jgi:uncharacterized iron-regulated membrane protein
VTKKIAPVKFPLRRWVRVAHLWTGVILGSWLVMLGLTGSALVYQHSLRQVLEQGRKIKPGVPALAIEDLLARVHQQRPDVTVFVLRGMQYRDSAIEVLVRPNGALRDTKQSKILLVDPGTGEINGTQSFSGTLIGSLAQLHFNLLSGDTGLAIKGFAGALAIFFAVTGLILWWRGRAKWKNGLRLKWKGASSWARSYSIHSAVGAYTSLFLFITGLSGIYFAASKPFISFAARLKLAVIDRRSAKVITARRTADLPMVFRAVFFLRPLHDGSFGGTSLRCFGSSWVSPQLFCFKQASLCGESGSPR